jgi:hypothetical protein
MQSSARPSSLWIVWLLAVSVGVSLFGLALVVAPTLARQGFSLLVYANPARLGSFGEEAARYISLAHAVLGGVMVGWGLGLAVVVRGLLASGSRLGWRLITISVGAWFIPDTAYSLWSGFWQNAVLNLVFLVLFAVPLAATYRHCRETNT